ncbi:VIT1/CCC1 transporter family protein [Candidatus Peregrinibacteria bacterium]|nr:VIT1/CCC1 transporter family protein [Candidatus Peregrinibacteria bacterium]
MRDDDVLKEHGVIEPYDWMADFVYGGIDGVVTTFAVVAGVEGASLSLPIILILGFANLFADGFSMAVGKYSSDKAGLEQYERIRQVEFEHLKTKTEHERQEIVEIMGNYGFKGKDLDRVVEIITSNPDAWVDLMMRNEFNMTRENVSPIKGAIATFISFVLVGFIPLIGYVFKGFLPLSDDGVFLTTIFFTLLALFIVGAVKSRFSVEKWYWSGAGTMFVGGLAAGIAYLVGYLLKGLI